MVNRLGPNSTIWRARILGGCILVITIAESFLLLDVVADFFRLDISTSWLDHSDIELLAVAGLGFALLITGKIFLDLLKEIRNYKTIVRSAAGQLSKVIDEKFTDWKLSPAERDIAFLLIKGLTLQEIANLRNTSPGTIKSQSNSIYRKAGLHGRQELISFFVEDLLAGEVLSAPIPENIP